VRGAITDDTQMTLATADGLRRARAGECAGDVVAAVRAAYLDWHAVQERRDDRSPGPLYRKPFMRASRSPGRTCMTALAAGGRGTIDEPINRSKGCGGVMRRRSARRRRGA
jgi:ADP-ribosyl-[dinitrogen reductase] hydrolase